MSHLDSSVDINLHHVPRLSIRARDNTINSLTNYHECEFNTILGSEETESLDTLDSCSSWMLHVPKGTPHNSAAGVGTSEK